MANLFDSADDYRPEMLRYVRQTCHYVATLLEDHLDDVVVVGGLVPLLLVPPDSLPEDASPHVGTRDLDLGLSLRLLDGEGYKAVSQRLKDAGFGPDVSEDTGHPTRQRWQIQGAGFPKITIDFLIGQADESHEPGRLHSLEKDFAAFIALAIPLAFRDRELVPMTGTTILGEQVPRTIRVPVCGPGAFVVLKALAFRHRGKFKDAYDLFWLVRNYPGAVEGVAARLRPLLDSAEALLALRILEEDFTQDDRTGPMRVARFQKGELDAELQAEVVAFLRRLLDLCKRSPGVS